MTLIFNQLFRFAVIGFGSNLLLYIIYLLLTHLGLGHKTTMSLLYATGVISTFIFNKNWTFSHQGGGSIAFVSYVAIYGIGYLLNLAGLYFFVDRLGYRHEWVQGILVILIALLLFFLQKTIVFKKRPSDAEI